MFFMICLTILFGKSRSYLPILELLDLPSNLYTLSTHRRFSTRAVVLFDKTLESNTQLFYFFLNLLISCINWLTLFNFFEVNIFNYVEIYYITSSLNKLAKSIFDVVYAICLK